MTSSVEVFGNGDLYGHLMRMFDLPTACRCRLVCTVWDNSFRAIEVSLVRDIHEHHGFFVQDGKYSYRSWIALAQTAKDCYNRATYMKNGLEPVGPDAKPTEYQINILWEEDPHSPGRKKFQTYSQLYLYPAVKRSVCDTEVAVFDEKGNLKITKPPEADSIPKEIEVGISPNNAIELFRHHPLKNKEENGLKFSYVDLVSQCNTASVCLSAPTVVFVRRGVPEATIDKPFPNTQVAGLVPLLFQAGFDLLETKTCAFEDHPKGKGICAWIPEAVHWGNQDRHLIFGYFDNGITIFCPWAKDGYIGAVPCILPELTQATPEAPAAEKKE